MFFWVPRWSGTLKNPKMVLYALQRTPFLTHFVGNLAQFGAKKSIFFNKRLALNDVFWVARCSGTLKHPKLAPCTPQRTPCCLILWAMWCVTVLHAALGTSKPNHSPRTPTTEHCFGTFGGAWSSACQKSSALFKPVKHPEPSGNEFSLEINTFFYCS